jgi:hypothetical protein
MKKLQKLREEATEWVKNNPDKRGIFGTFISRSCWICNPAHFHLKDANYPIECFDCGHIYYKGIDITITAQEERLEKLENINKQNE